MYVKLRHNADFKYPKDYEQHIKNLYDLYNKLNHRIDNIDYLQALKDTLLNDQSFINCIAQKLAGEGTVTQAYVDAKDEETLKNSQTYSDEKFLPPNESGVVTYKGTSFLDMVSNKISNLAEPTADSDAATKSYIDKLIGGGA